jgi:hypothetical protein
MGNRGLSEIQEKILDQLNQIPEFHSFMDIGCMKISALVSRGSKKDFIDLHRILQSGITFKELWEAYKKKFRADDDEMYNLLKSMVYFEDAETETLEEDIEKKWPGVKHYFIKLAGELTKQNHH